MQQRNGSVCVCVLVPKPLLRTFAFVHTSISEPSVAQYRLKVLSFVSIASGVCGTTIKRAELRPGAKDTDRVCAYLCK